MRILCRLNETKRQCTTQAASVFQSTYTLYKECIAVKCTVYAVLATHQQVQPCIRANCAIRFVAVGLGNTVQLPAYFLGSGLRQAQKQGCLCSIIRVDVFQIPHEIGLCTLCLFDFSLTGSYFTLGTDAFFLENSLFLFKLHNLVVELRLVQ